jgi:septal ring factor EnvC (AmiA/AmiB activator)
LLKSDMAQVRAEGVKVESDVASVKADIARMETSLEAFREFANDRFDRMDEWMNSKFASLGNQISVASERYGEHSEQMKALSEQIRAQSAQFNSQSSHLLSVILTEIKSLKQA